MAESYKLIFYKADLSFEAEACHHYGLAMVSGLSYLSIAVADMQRGRYIAMYHLVRQESYHNTEQPAFGIFLDEVTVYLPWLKNSFKSLRIAFNASCHTLVPDALFDPEQAGSYLELMYGPLPGHTIMAEPVEVLDAHQVFAVPEEVPVAFKRHFPRSRLISHATVLIHAIWANHSRIHTLKVFLHIRHEAIDIMVFDGKQVSFINSFAWRSPEDILYYVVFVMEQLNLNPEVVPVVVSGDTEGKGALMDMIFTYVRHVEFAKRSNIYRFSAVLDEIPPHSRFLLFNLLTCGL